MRIIRILVRLLRWAVLWLLGIVVAGFCLGVGMGLGDIYQRDDPVRFAVAAVASIVMVAVVTVGWNVTIGAVRRFL